MSSPLLLLGAPDEGSHDSHIIHVHVGNNLHVLMIFTCYYL